jgi:hypothetical protein
MSASGPQNSLRVFHAVIDDLAENLQFVDYSMRLRPRLGEMIDWKSISGDPKELITRFLGSRDVSERSFSAGFVVALSGAFEAFVSSLVRAAVAEWNACGDFDLIPQKIRDRHVYFTGRALSTIFEPLDHFQVDYHLFAKNLATCESNAKSFTMNVEAFSIFILNLTPKHLEDIMRYIDIPFNWDEVGAVTRLQQILGAKGTRETAKKAQDRLAEFIQLRNRIAHGGISSNNLTVADVLDYLEFFRVFSEKLSKIVVSSLPKAREG